MSRLCSCGGTDPMQLRASRLRSGHTEVLQVRDTCVPREVPDCRCQYPALTIETLRLLGGKISLTRLSERFPRV
jgi:hypothetical protein